MSEQIRKYKYEYDARQVNFRLSQEYCDKLIAQKILPPEFDRKILSNVIRELIEQQLDQVEMIKPAEMPDLMNELQIISKRLELIEGKAQPKLAS